MTREWRPIKDAPKDGTVILLWGKLRDPGLTEWHSTGKLRVVGYWDHVDSAWSLVSTPWTGPFFDPVCWAELPDAPCEQLEKMLEDGWVKTGPTEALTVDREAFNALIESVKNLPDGNERLIEGVMALAKSTNP